AGVLDLRLIAFAQEGIFRDGVTRDLLREALKAGLAVLGGCPSMDRDQPRHIDWFFDTAQDFGVPLDFHADSADDPAMLTSDYIAEQTIIRGMQGRVTVGHLGTLDVLTPDHRARVIDKLREAGLHVISLPATELHVKGRGDDRRTWRGVTRIAELRAAGINVALSTNNIVNPFTPYGHPDLLPQALVAAMAGPLGNLEQMPCLWASAARSAATRARAREAGLEDAGTLEAVVRASRVILSVVPPHGAADLARAVAALGFRGLYVDANAVAPSTAREMGRVVEAAGARFVDGGIIGPATRTRRGVTRVYLAGPGATEVAAWFRAGPPG